VPGSHHLGFEASFRDVPHLQRRALWKHVEDVTHGHCRYNGCLNRKLADLRQTAWRLHGPEAHLLIVGRRPQVGLVVVMRGHREEELGRAVRGVDVLGCAEQCQVGGKNK